MTSEAPSFPYIDSKGQEKTGEILPSVENIYKTWHDLIAENTTPEEAEVFERHIQLFKINGKKSTEYFLILTDVKPQKIDELINKLGAEKEPMNMDKFLLKVWDAKNQANLPNNFDQHLSQVYRIIG